MTDSNSNTNLPTPPEKSPGTIGRVRRLARRGRNRLAKTVRAGLEGLGDMLRDQLRDVLNSPQQVEALQRALANFAGWTLRQGFRSDPNAELLFHFVDWLEKRHDRHTITAILLHSSLLRDPAFIDALVHLTQLLSPLETTDPDDHWSASKIDGFKKRAGDQLLALLVELAALECDDAPPTGSTEERIAYFEQAPIPVRFTRLAAMTQGQKLLSRPNPKRRSAWAKRLADRIGSTDRSESALARFVPGLGDDTLHFLVFSTTFFLQSYLLRNLIEALPDLADDLNRALREDEIIDLN